MRISLKLDQKELEQIIRRHLHDKLGLEVRDVTLYSKSTQNYRATWEKCAVIVVNEEGKLDHNAAFPKDPLPVMPELRVEVSAE